MFENQSALPPELITEITGYLIDDKDSVLSSALTCHTWYNATRQCFYHKISISSKERLETLEELVDENPTIGCWVRILRVSEMHSVNWVIHIPGIARKLPNVRTLEMSKLWQHISHSNPEWFESLSQFTSIQHLSLDRCMFSVNFLKSLVSSLPHVKALSLARTNIDEYSFDIGSIFEVPYDEKDPEMPCLHEPRLEEFSVDTSVFSSCEGVCEWLRTTESVSTLRTIIYPIDSLTSFKEIGDLLVAAGGQLEYLECSMAKEVSKSVYPENGFAQYFKLSHHTGLRHIKHILQAHGSVQEQRSQGTR
ncbi:unnamed protein product [Somion occarium]|uniref:F-box domain-containing protein n=1 Tax=Somion occarium TaxID=3059160 RepID=A0ABP1DWG5_9APHY